MLETPTGIFQATQGTFIYRVLVGTDRLVGVRVDGRGTGAGDVALHQLGLIGAVILYFVAKRREKAEAALKAATSQWDLDEQLRANPKNFEVRYSSVVRAAIAKPGGWQKFISGSTLASLTFELAQPAKPLTLYLKTPAELASCRAALGAALGSQLTTDPQLDGMPGNQTARV
jgi:hypothetical protein